MPLRTWVRNSESLDQRKAASGKCLGKHIHPVNLGESRGRLKGNCQIWDFRNGGWVGCHCLGGNSLKDAGLCGGRDASIVDCEGFTNLWSFQVKPGRQVAPSALYSWVVDAQSRTEPRQEVYVKGGAKGHTQRNQRLWGRKRRCWCSVALSCLTLLWTVARQTPLSIGFSRQEYGKGLPFPSPGDLPNPGFESQFPAPFALAGRFFAIEPPGKPQKEKEAACIQNALCKPVVLCFLPELTGLKSNDNRPHHLLGLEPPSSPLPKVYQVITA